MSSSKRQATNIKREFYMQSINIKNVAVIRGDDLLMYNTLKSMGYSVFWCGDNKICMYKNSALSKKLRFTRRK